jgi:hypothetical protein
MNFDDETDFFDGTTQVEVLHGFRETPDGRLEAHTMAGLPAKVLLVVERCRWMV